MPASDTLEFNCPNCQVSLLVPKNNAGVSGPCPHCEASITSPSPIPQPLRNKPNPSPSIPEVRQILPPQKEDAPTKDVDNLDDDQKWSEDEDEKKRSGCWPALLFIFFLAVVSYFILSFLGLVPHWRTIPSKLFPKAQRIEQSPGKTDKKELLKPIQPTPISVTPPKDPTPKDPPPEPDPFIDIVADTPRECLKLFLAAKMLDQRQAFMTISALSEDELRQSILSGPFPDSHPPQVETKLAAPGSPQTESYYTITFRTPLKEGVESMTLKVVSAPTGSTPKVDTDFFLDLLRAPVTQLNQNISPEPLTFQAIVEASAYCFDDIPNSDSMARLIFFRNMDAKASPLSTAYLAQNSPLFQRLKKHDTPGVHIPATVTVKWNQTIDPSKPFLEVIDLKSPALK